MTERTIVLPVKDNNGISLAAQNRVIREKLLEIAGGYSEYKQTGYWRDDRGKVCRDVSWRVVATVTAEQDADIQAWLPTWAGWLRQQCLYTHTAAVSADFVYPASKENVTGAA